jgi:hypothetical protein
LPRPITWLPRLHEIRRSVTNSIRSHYDRRDLEALFELQPRAAQKLVEMLPTVRIGTSHLIERDVLGRFLERVRDAEDMPRLFAAIREEKAGISRRKVRSLVRRDHEPVGLTSLPDSIGLTPGRLEVRFRTVEELAQAMYTLARILENDGEEFAQAYEPQPSTPDPQDPDEARALFADLEAMQAGRCCGS